MSNANKSQPEDEWVDEVELPDEADFSLAALDFLSADITPPNGNAASDDFFDTGALTSLASLGWRDTDAADSDAVPEESVVQQNGTSEQTADDLLELAESLTGPSLDDDETPEMVADSFTQSVPDNDNEDGLLDLAESFTQSASDELDESLLDLAELFTGDAVEDTGATPEVDDETPTIVISSSNEIAALQAELTVDLATAQADDTIREDDAELIALAEMATELEDNDAPDSTLESDSADDLLAVAETATELEPSQADELLEIAEAATELEPTREEDDLLEIAEAATQFEPTQADELIAESLPVDEMESDLLEIAEAATEPQRVEPLPVLDDDLLALAEGSLDDEGFLNDLLDLSADSALDALLDENAPTESELDALLDEDSRYLDQIVAGLDAETEQFVAEEAQEIQLLTAQRELRTGGKQYVVFTLDDTQYGIPVANVLEVGEPQEPTVVPFVPHWVRGIINLRGEIISLVDLRGFLHGVNSGDAGWMIISQTQDETVTVGLLVDDVRGNRQFGSHQQTDIGAGLADETARFLQTVFEENGQMIAALDFERLLNSAEMRQFEI